MKMNLFSIVFLSSANEGQGSSSFVDPPSTLILSLAQFRKCLPSSRFGDRAIGVEEMENLH